ncbi:MAG TPA: tetratricopeptide repeat protein [Candidatus Binataceae bacterium]|nr:tetratricopeptide repeat protein [Candidatus Binataceae bacterium]
MRQTRSLIIRSEDHLNDRLGVIFLVGPDEIGDIAIERLGEYFGRGVHIIKAVVARDRVEVEVEASWFPEESNRLVEAAVRLRERKLYRSAQSLLKEAIELDPLNANALFESGLILAHSGTHSEALAMFVRARETGPENAAMFNAMGAACIKQERASAAIGYLRRALELEPKNFMARRMLGGLGHKPPAAERPKPDKSDRAAKTKSK